MNNIVLYTIGCPQCEILKTMLDKAEIEYEICTDTEIMRDKNYLMLPVLEVNGDPKSYVESIKWIKEQEK